MHRKTLDQYRDRFKHAPLGRWKQAAGTFSVVMDELWEFNPDHTGRIIQTSAFSGEDEAQFEWKEVADFTIACRTKWPDEDDQAEAEADAAPWVTVRYDFRIVSTDYGELVAMYQLADDGTIRQGFWYSLSPLINIDDH